MKINKKKIEKILFILRRGGMGDLIVSSPIIEVLAKHFPESEITCLVNPQFAPILKNNPYVKDCISFEPTVGLLKQVKTLKKGKYDLAIAPWTTSEEAHLTYLSGIPLRVGQGGRILYSHFFTHKVNVRSTHGDRKSHWVDCQLDYVRSLGLDAEPIKPRIWLSDEEKETAWKSLSQHGITKNDTLCGLHIGKGMELNLQKWPIDKFISLGNLLAGKIGFKLVLTGGVSEIELVRTLEKAIKFPVINMAGKTDLRLLSGIISQMSVFICPDSGPVHISAAVGTPTISIFALNCEVAERWHPYGVPYRIIRTSNFDCDKRCIKEKCEYFKCLLAIDENEVMTAILNLVNKL